MKNVILLLLAAVCVYQYLNPQVVERVKEVRVEVPAAPAKPRLYYHSPLDAPAMPTGESTGTGYFSAERSSRFGPATLTSYSRPSTGGSYTPPRSVTPSADSINPLQSVEAIQAKLAENP